MSLRSFLKAPHLATLDPNDPRHVTGTEEDRRRARSEWYRARYIADVLRSNLPEIPRASLAPVLRHLLEDTRDGQFYRPRRDELVDLTHTDAVGYYVGADGMPILLERPTGLKNRAELEQRQAEREQRRNAPKPLRPWAEQPR